MTQPESAPSAALSAIGRTWALLLGICLLMLGNGLQGTLLGVRATLEGYSNELIGLLMSGFFAGFLLGATWTPRAVNRVGHVRVFAALASLASVSILVHSVVIDPIVWGLMRVVTGVCFAGIFVVAESWLNEAADNESRGQLLAVYMMTQFLGLAGGQMLLNVADPAQAELFILVSVLISLAAIPLLLSATKVPAQVEPVAVGLRRLYRVSPLGTLGTLGAGLINGTVFGMGAVYAAQAGLSVSEIALFMGVLIVGAAILQWPIGKLSDLLDRRVVILTVAFTGCVLAVVAGLMVEMRSGWYPLAVAVYGGFGLSLHALCIAHTNDHLEPTELVGASSALVLILAAGSVVGPPVAGFAMGVVGASGYFWWLAAIGLWVGALSLWRMTRRASLPNEDQGPFVPITAQTSSVAMAAAEEVHAEEVQSEEAPPAGGDQSR